MKKILTILFLIMLIISFFQITSMYALYKERLQGEYNTLLGAWKIKINEKDVTTTEQVETFTISATDQLGYVKSSYIQAGKIAPEGQAFFNIEIDPTNTDVSIIYEIEIDETAMSQTNTGIQLENALELVRGENYFGQGDDGQTNRTENDLAYKEDDKNIYTSVIPIEKIKQNYKNYVTVYFKWKNVTQTTGEGQNQVVTEPNNTLDTQLGTTENSTLQIPIRVTLKQYTGELIGNGS